MRHPEIERWEEARGWSLPDEAHGRLRVLLGLWVRYGAVMNLSGARDEATLLPHVLDGLDAAWLVRRASDARGEAVRWMDFGSGGGFPGLVVAAVSDWPMVLIEPRQKRASFLEMSARSIGRGSIEVVRARFERSTWNENPLSGMFAEQENTFRVVSARAVWDPETWLEIGAHVVRSGGHVVIHLSSAESPRDFAISRVVESARGWVGLVDVDGADEVR